MCTGSSSFPGSFPLFRNRSMGTRLCRYHTFFCRKILNYNIGKNFLPPPPPPSQSQHAHTPHIHRIDRAVSRVYRLAMQDFTNPRLASSCAAFIEMVDRDSTLLRVDLQAALRIARHGHQQQQQGERARGYLIAA